jgi:hypothetical protein
MVIGRIAFPNWNAARDLSVSSKNHLPPLTKRRPTNAASTQGGTHN